MRNFLAVLAGLVVGMAVNLAFVQLNTRVLYPMPPGTSMQDPEQFNAYLATLPDTAFIVVLVAHLGQAFVGGWVAARLAASRPMTLALIVGALSLLGGVVNMTMVEHPTWMYVELPLYLVVAGLAGKIEERRRGAA